ncbi:MAG: DUF2892 domain-containing protein [Opitutales bacterium]|nr:DUF2892 domain-containing protein [Opitutales bacterium]
MKKSNSINIDRAVFLFGGIVILISVVLTLWVSQWWLILTAFVGLNMIQSAFTGFCPPAILFRKLGMPSGCAFKGKTE